MSNALAIAAVTATLRWLLEKSLEPEGAGIPVTTQPLDKANDANKTRRGLNLFLYETAVNAAWRNQPLPNKVQQGETGFPPLSLDLYYLITAYSDGEEIGMDHRLLGRAMSMLHDHPLLSPDNIKAMLPDSDLQNQIERVRITFQPLSLEEMSKLWSAFNTQYRISTAYQASVVLIESTRDAKTPLPVLTRGPNDTGPVSQPDLTPPFPALNDLIYPTPDNAAHLGDTLSIDGVHLDQGTLLLRFSHPLLSAPIELPPPPFVSLTPSSLTFKLPDPVADPSQLTKWPAGMYILLADLKQGPDERTTNALAFSLAPSFTNALPMSVARDGSGNATLVINCAPDIWPGQKVSLLVGDRQVDAEPILVQTNTLMFVVTAAIPGKYFLRLRVDGVDSLLIDHTKTPAVFDSNQMVTIS